MTAGLQQRCAATGFGARVDPGLPHGLCVSNLSRSITNPQRSVGPGATLEVTRTHQLLDATRSRDVPRIFTKESGTAHRRRTRCCPWREHMPVRRAVEVDTQLGRPGERTCGRQRDLQRLRDTTGLAADTASGRHCSSRGNDPPAVEAVQPGYHCFVTPSAAVSRTGWGGPLPLRPRPGKPADTRAPLSVTRRSPGRHAQHKE